MDGPQTHYAEGKKLDVYNTIPFRWKSRKGTSVKIESRLVAASGWGGNRKWLQTGTRHLPGDGNVLKQDCGDGYTNLYVY